MLEDVRKDIEKLIALYEAKNEENKRLKESLEQSKAENATFRKKIEELEEEVENLHLAEAFRTTSGNGAEAKERIDKLIKEMDKCISMLEN